MTAYKNPKLRFKDENGKDFPVWDELKLSQLAEFRRGSFPQPYGLPEWYDNEKGMPFVQVFDVDENLQLKSTTKQKISKKAQEKSVFVPKGNVLITIQGSIGRVAITQYDSYVDRTLLIFQNFKYKININFFALSLHLLFQLEKEKAPGGTIKTITKEQLSSFKIYLPEITEQKKIADFLTSVDNYIQNLKSQKEELEKYKKGMMQKIFSQQLRFKDENGKDFPDWTKIYFDNLLISTSERNSNKKIDLVLSVNNKKGFIKQSEQFEDREVASKDTRNYKVVFRNEYAYNPARINIGSIARLTNYESGIVSPMYSCFKLNNNILPEYFDLILKTKEFSDFVDSSVSGSVRKTLNYDDLLKFNLLLPEMTEQIIISKFINSINQYNENLSNKIDLLENWKKGLMQQMFI